MALHHCGPGEVARLFGGDHVAVGHEPERRECGARLDRQLADQVHHLQLGDQRQPLGHQDRRRGAALGAAALELQPRAGVAREGGGLAAALGRNPSAVNRMVRGERHIRASELPIILKYLDEPGGAGVSVAAPPPSDRVALDAMPRLNARFAEDAALPPYRSEMPKDVPVYGTVVGGDGQDTFDFELNGTVVDRVRRPPRIAGRSDVFAVYVSGGSMAPWREPGQLIYVEVVKSPKALDYVLIEFRPRDGQGVRPALVKRLLSITPTKLRVRQFDPPKDFDIERRAVLRILRVMDWDELMGV